MIERKVDIAELKTMMKQFWVVDNNAACLKATIIFLRRLGLDMTQIKHWLFLEEWDKEDYEITSIENKRYFDRVIDTKEYDLEKFEEKQ